MPQRHPDAAPYLILYASRTRTSRPSNLSSYVGSSRSRRLSSKLGVSSSFNFVPKAFIDTLGDFTGGVRTTREKDRFVTEVDDDTMMSVRGMSFRGGGGGGDLDDVIEGNRKRVRVYEEVGRTEALGALDVSGWWGRGFVVGWGGDGRDKDGGKFSIERLRVGIWDANTGEFWGIGRISLSKMVWEGGVGRGRTELKGKKSVEVKAAICTGGDVVEGSEGKFVTLEFGVPLWKTRWRGKGDFQSVEVSRADCGEGKWWTTWTCLYRSECQSDGIEHADGGVMFFRPIVLPEWRIMGPERPLRIRIFGGDGKTPPEVSSVTVFTLSELQSMDPLVDRLDMRESSGGEKSIGHWKLEIAEPLPTGAIFRLRGILEVQPVQERKSVGLVRSISKRMMCAGNSFMKRSKSQQLKRASREKLTPKRHSFSARSNRSGSPESYVSASRAIILHNALPLNSGPTNQEVNGAMPLLAEKEKKEARQEVSRDNSASEHNSTKIEAPAFDENMKRKRSSISKSVASVRAAGAMTKLRNRWSLLRNRRKKEPTLN